MVHWKAENETSTYITKYSHRLTSPCPHQIWPLAPFASLHVEFEADEPVAADHPLTILQTTVGLLPDVR